MSQLPPPLPSNPPSSQNAPSTIPGSLQSFGEPHRGGLILALGIISLTVNFLSSCGGAFSGGLGCFATPLAIGLAIPAWIMANTDLAKMATGRMDASGRGSTQGGKICGIISIVLTVVIIAVTILFFLGLLAFLGIAAGAQGRP
jgi:hypothetical protein